MANKYKVIAALELALKEVEIRICWMLRERASSDSLRAQHELRGKIMRELVRTY